MCSAINHAHQKGIIHRDIKPSNVMVTLNGDKPLVKVIDFGIAKATQGKLTDKTLFTRFEQFIGTPVYMSPEQASTSGTDIDTRSDIYALGILLYELLTGKPPFDAKSLASAGYEEMRRIIREVEPPKPSSRLSTVMGEERTLLAKARHIEPGKVNRMVEPDLDWIVMKAIEKDRARRYETANGLAQDIQRFLADEPVSATPPSAAYRFRKFARRNKTALRVAAGIAVLLIAATAVSSWLAIRATTAETLAQGRLLEKDAALEDAQALIAFLTEVFRSPDPTRDGKDIKVVELLKASARKLDTGLASQPERRMHLQLALGVTYLSLGLARDAIPLFEKARDDFRAVHGPEHRLTLGAMQVLANAYEAAERKDDALHLREVVVEIRSRVVGAEDAATLSAMGNLAASYSDAGRRQKALELREKVLDLSRKVNGPEHPETFSALGNLANSYAETGRPQEAHKLYGDVLELSRRVNGREHPNTLFSILNLALSMEEAGQGEEALKLREELVELSRKVYGMEHRDTRQWMNNLAERLDAVGRVKEALKLREELLPARREFDGLEHRDTLGAMTNLAVSLALTGALQEAIDLQEKALVLKRRLMKKGDPFREIALEHMEMLYTMDHRPEKATEIRKEIDELKGTATAQPPSASRSKEAAPAPAVKDIKALEKALEDIRQSQDAKPADKVSAMTALAAAYVADGSGRKAIKLAEEALALARSVLPAGDPRTKNAMNVLIPPYKLVGLDAEAAKLEEELRALSNSTPGPE